MSFGVHVRVAKTRAAIAAVCKVSENPVYVGRSKDAIFGPWFVVLDCVSMVVAAAKPRFGY
jgi:hypothetical protein